MEFVHYYKTGDVGEDGVCDRHAKMSIEAGKKLRKSHGEDYYLATIVTSKDDGQGIAPGPGWWLLTDRLVRGWGKPTRTTSVMPPMSRN